MTVTTVQVSPAGVVSRTLDVWVPSIGDHHALPVDEVLFKDAIFLHRHGLHTVLHHPAGIQHKHVNMSTLGPDEYNGHIGVHWAHTVP